MITSTPEFTPVHVLAASTPAPRILASPNPAIAQAQATVDAGQSQLSDLSRRSTEVSLNMSQAANASALSTQDYNRRQKVDLDYQSTVVSLNITQAAATQKYISQQTKMDRDATSTAQSIAAAATHSAFLVKVTQTAQAQANLDSQSLQTAQAASTLTAYPLTATYSAYLINVTETAQAQVLLNAQATQAALAIASLTAYPMTATPFAVTQAALLMQQYNREQQSFINQIVAPLIPILAALDLVLLILLIINITRGSILNPWPRRLRFTRGGLNPDLPVIIDGEISEPSLPLQPIPPPELPPVIPPQPPEKNLVHVEIVNATEPPVAHWIVEVEDQLAAQGGS